MKLLSKNNKKFCVYDINFVCKIHICLCQQLEDVCKAPSVIHFIAILLIRVNVSHSLLSVCGKCCFDLPLQPVLLPPARWAPLSTRGNETESTRYIFFSSVKKSDSEPRMRARETVLPLSMIPED